MRSKLLLLCLSGVFLLLSLNGSVNGQPSDLAGKTQYDTVDIAIDYSTAYPGTETWVTVWMNNPVPVGAFSLFFQLSSMHAARFSCDTSGQCFIDSTSCSAGALSHVSCLCQGNGSGVEVLGWGEPGEFIPPSPGYECLFRIRMDVCCIPDADTLRSAYILLAPGTSSVSDTLGNLLPWRYSMGELFVWASVPGDASGDSLVDIGDVLFLINYLYQGGPKPCVCEAADCNNDEAINSADIVYLINYLFANGPAPVRGSAACWHEDCRP